MTKSLNFDVVRCRHAAWRLWHHNGVWQATYCSNNKSAACHSLGTADRSEALRRLRQLDEVRAAELDLPRPSDPATVPVQLFEGWSLYEQSIKRSVILGGKQPSTEKSRRSVFETFFLFCYRYRVESWNAVSEDTLTAYAAFLADHDYHPRTLRREVNTLVQAQHWLVNAKQLLGNAPIAVSDQAIENQRAYSFTGEQVAAMVDYCGANADLGWLAGVIIALACTGLSVGELARLRWTDVDLARGRLKLVDESNRPRNVRGRRRLPKSTRSRSVPIPPDLATVLKPGSRSNEFVFRGPRGGRLSDNTVRLNFIKKVINPLRSRFPSDLCERGFKDGCLNSFRHYYLASSGARPGVAV